jgi:hypothetical protein
VGGSPWFEGGSRGTLGALTGIVRTVCAAHSAPESDEEPPKKARGDGRTGKAQANPTPAQALKKHSSPPPAKVRNIIQSLRREKSRQHCVVRVPRGVGLEGGGLRP